ncbi:Major facilitator superfamily protein [Mycena chlorophos]|uniref:Major facilitator superfamily protein n=1 Tax=Mycena chlorophos TaxID=658473 RepID=A0A8H6SJF6_MYCCL|nr:Major facilitator superfamily protein [Mycena chlorophos]
MEERRVSSNDEHTIAEEAEKPQPQVVTAPPTAPADESLVLTGSRLAVVFTALLFSVLLIALDQTILATALPRIASDFDSFALQGWVATAFVLAQTIFLLFYGQLMRIFPAKYILLSTITLFEAGSLLCALAPNVGALIAGRTVTGFGAAGMFVAVLQIMAQSTRLEDRPRLFSLFGVVFGISSIIGPLIGGAFTDHVTWRWCFYLNLPFGGVTLVVVTLLLKAAPPLGADSVQRTWGYMGRQVLRLDYVGATLVAGAVTSFILALQWGGNTKPWNSAAVIVCLVLGPVIGVITILWEIWLGVERAMVPTTIFKSKSIYAIIFYSILSRFAMLIYTYYIPIYYQAARHRTATQSGIDLLPLMLGTIITMIATGQLVTRWGYYYPFLLVGPVFLAIGSGLLYTLSPSTSGAKVIGFQILAGVGLGLSAQNTLLAMQVEFRSKGEAKLLGQASSMASFGQFLGGTLGLGVAEPVFASELTKFLAKYAPDAPAAVVKESPTAIYSALSEAQIPGVVHAYVASLRIVFVLGVPVAALCLLSAFFIENIKIPKEEAKPKGGDVEKVEGA